MKIDLSNLPICEDGQPADYVISSINGGLTIFAKVGNIDEQFGDTPQEALDNAIAFFNSSDEAVINIESWVAENIADKLSQPSDEAVINGKT